MNIEKLNSTNFIDNQDILNKFEKSYLNSNLAHSTIIYGEKGIGKSTFVKYFINKIFTNFSEDKIKNSKHTTLILNNSHPNVRIISKLIDEKTKKLKINITIDQIRNLESLTYQSSIVDLPEPLSPIINVALASERSISVHAFPVDKRFFHRILLNCIINRVQSFPPKIEVYFHAQIYIQGL